ncbi:hypothetical protein L1999_16755 [Neobacillus drentensis]|uniref:hypothetical protein n=1 Tax=Neobacillus drentensis TaxID=220684 RepID=UPI001F40CB1E|nr:hypothetical protein [Neobacillus drentensis]ULT54792.1 hypothetical protein L1999_16755 [Neobacillus drentensis]
MLLYFPSKFDGNEWTIILALLLNILVFTFLPKRIPKEITPLLVLLSISFPKIMDTTLAVKPLNFYNLNDTSQYEIFDLALYGVYPAFGYLFIYFYDYYKFKGYGLVLYFIIWSLAGVSVEFLLVHFHVFVYKGWQLFYSLPIYIVVLPLTFMFYKFVSYYLIEKPQNQAK